MTVAWEVGVLWGALGAGGAAALAALYGRYRDLPAFLTGAVACGTGPGGSGLSVCETLFRTPRAALLGVPNALLGLLLYGLLAVGLLRNWPAWFLCLAATPGFAMSVFLGASLLRRNLRCRICWAGHIANALLWLTLGFQMLHPDG
ncbi:MAG: hypothetical protein HY608_04125 [Planctomycetes bacterium]|nr:hypothetical protein [Planctomycetota bacterium]